MLTYADAYTLRSERMRSAISSLAVSHGDQLVACAKEDRSGDMEDGSYPLLLYCCFTAALLFVYCCCTAGGVRDGGRQPHVLQVPQATSVRGLKLLVY